MDTTRLSVLARLRQSPDEQGWSEFDGIYRTLLLRWLQRHHNLGEDANDLAQEILLTVWPRVRAFEHRGKGSFRGWLRQIMVNHLKAYYRARQHRPDGRGGADSDEALLQLADDDNDLVRRWDREYDEYLISRLLEMMAREFSDVQIRAFRRYVLDGITPASKVAEELGVTDNVVLKAKSHVLRRLREIGEGFLE